MCHNFLPDKVTFMTRGILFHTKQPKRVVSLDFTGAQFKTVRRGKDSQQVYCQWEDSDKIANVHFLLNKTWTQTATTPFGYTHREQMNMFDNETVFIQDT